MATEWIMEVAGPPAVPEELEDSPDQNDPLVVVPMDLGETLP